jgi:hypothetical protein
LFCCLNFIALAQDYLYSSSSSSSSSSYGCEDVSSYYASVKGEHHSPSYTEVWDDLKFLDAANVDRPQASSGMYVLLSFCFWFCDDGAKNLVYGNN